MDKIHKLALERWEALGEAMAEQFGKAVMLNADTSQIFSVFTCAVHDAAKEAEKAHAEKRIKEIMPHLTAGR